MPINQSNLLLQHKIEGRPLPVVQWFKEGVPLSMMPKLFKLETTNTLIDQYKYRVTSKVTFIGEYIILPNFKVSGYTSKGHHSYLKVLLPFQRKKFCSPIREACIRETFVCA